MITLMVICALLLVASVFFCRGRWYAPSVLSSGVWLLSIGAYVFIDGGKHPLHQDTIQVLIIWMVSFCVACWCVQSIYVKPLLHGVRSNSTARDIYYYFTLCTLPIMVVEMVVVLLHSGGNPFAALRDANVSGVNGVRTTGFFVVFWMVSYLMELHVVDKRNIGRVILLFLVNLFYAFISMGKMNLMILFVASAIILTERKAMKLRHIAIGGVILILSFLCIQIIRGSFTDVKEFSALYLTSSVANLDTNVVPESADKYGENTFRLYYAIKGKLDGGRTQPIDPILPFSRVEIGRYVFGSNTYTCLYPFYKDFGVCGVVVFAIFLGVFFSYLFKTSEDGSQYALVLYALLSCSIVMQIIGDTFFSVLSQTIQYMVASLIPYIISKYRLFDTLRGVRKDG